MTRMADSHKGRWLRFSLRGMLLITTALAIWIGWNAKAVRERKSAIADLQQAGAHFLFRTHYETFAQRYPARAFDLKELPQVPWVRRLLGDQAVVELFVPSKLPSATVEAAKLALPEATVTHSDYIKLLY